MKVDSRSMLLYAVTDRAWLHGRTLPALVEDAVRGGATFVQLREKDMEFAAFLDEARRVKAVTDRYHVPFVINDDVEVARACNADGVHVGQDDATVSEARRVLGPDKIIGVSVHTVDEARAAEQAGADYAGVGAVFSTSTKLDAGIVTFQTLCDIRTAVSIPIVAIGGVNAENMLQLKGSGIDGIAVVSALFAQQDVYAAAERLYTTSKELIFG
ncbi:thiamine phosphate synthase [Anaerotruncus colihominis]|uniref:thiamine phosphate synthase n=1 Tax=Anaerotruncus colihominis TaxID=169435 RepID=UPI0035139734